MFARLRGRETATGTAISMPTYHSSVTTLTACPMKASVSSGVSPRAMR
ncbi:MAG: hypothetical protein A4E31_00221 [Methanomassiliicoccales archaeon PtaU1.Bin030]|nr:MAG: hypothetical protein A4E31_00221 [Methanomassiliicoccales archaeon PtaU1.Bin030]